MGFWNAKWFKNAKHIGRVAKDLDHNIQTEHIVI